MSGYVGASFFGATINDDSKPDVIIVSLKLNGELLHVNDTYIV